MLSGRHTCNHVTTCDQDKVKLKLCTPANSDLFHYAQCSLRMCELLAGMHAALPSHFLGLSMLRIVVSLLAVHDARHELQWHFLTAGAGVSFLTSRSWRRTSPT